MSHDSRIRVLTLLEYYLPGFKSGGALRTLVNMVERLGDGVDFRIVTADRDVNDSRPFDGIRVDAWNDVGGARVFYASPRWAGAWSPAGMRRLIADVAPDVVYLNSFFAPLMVRYLAWRRAGLLPARPTLLAPRGELTPGALRLKAAKKRAYLAAARALGLWDGVLWQASSEREQAEILGVVGHPVRVHVAPDLLPAGLEDRVPSPGPRKEPGTLRLVFLSRISPVKNLDFVLRLLGGVPGDIEFDLFGAVRDDAHWEACRAIIATLPANIRVTWRGEVANEQVPATLARYHAFVLPTLGENFGHAIFEALAAGRPVLISDRTPWRGLAAAGAGWDLPLEREDAWRDALATAVAMDDAAFRTACGAARRFAVAWASRADLVESNRALFVRAMEPGR